ncbi:MerR family transcriptional regulator [Methylocella silvestris]|nr:MerR family transcriptional regulator [Methylocella silvestris]
MARDFGVSIRALRFYEDRGLLSPKRQGATRLYGARERRNLKMILKGKQLGFTLAEISAMLASQSELLEADTSDLEMALPPEQIIAQIGFLERQRKELDAAIVELRKAHCRLVETSFLGATA